MKEHLTLLRFQPGDIRGADHSDPRPQRRRKDDSLQHVDWHDSTDARRRICLRPRRHVSDTSLGSDRQLSVVTGS